MRSGQIVKLRELPFKVRLFKLIATNGSIEWVITNHPSFVCSQVVEPNGVRCQIEQLQSALKQLTGIEKCPTRRARAQRIHIALCYQVWLPIKCHAKRLARISYQVVSDLLSDYLRAERSAPHIVALQLAH